MAVRNGRQSKPWRAAVTLVVALAVALAMTVVAPPETAEAATVPTETWFSSDGKPLRLLTWAGPDARSPVVFAIHGGGFSRGSVEGSTAFCELLVARLPVACISPGYRLDSPTPRVLRQATDVVNAIRYVRQHASAYRIDPDHVAVQGGSAGGTLALLVNAFGVRVDAIIDASGITDFVNLVRDGGSRFHDATTKVVKLAVGCTTATASCLSIKAAHSPVTWAGRINAPTLICHSDVDFIDARQGQRVRAVLAFRSIPNRLLVTDASHGVCPIPAVFDWLTRYLLS